MSITVDSPFRAPARISRERWLAVIAPAFSTPLFNGIPSDDRPAVASAMYDLIVRSGHDPAVLLAIGIVEHGLGSNPDSVLWRNDTRSLTNARTVRDPSLTGWEIVTDAKRGSNYVRYQTVVDSLIDGMYRVDEPGYAYRKAGAVSIIEHTLIWTEGDGAPYAAKMVALIEGWMAADGKDTPMTPLTPPAGWKPPEIVRRILPWQSSNTPGALLRGGDWNYLTVHNTGNPRATADALMHAKWLEGLAKAGATEPSWHYTIDDTRIVQHLEDTWAAYHASDGDGDGNFDSLGLELVEVGVQERVMWNAGWLIATRLRSKSKGLSAVRQHYDWARDKKNCPRLLRANNGAGWKQLLAIVTHFLAQDAPGEPPLLLEGNPFGAYGYRAGFRAHVLRIGGAVFPSDPVKGALAVFGWPTSDEFVAVDGSTYQFAERYTLQWIPGNPPPFDIVGLIRGESVPDRRVS